MRYFFNSFQKHLLASCICMIALMTLISCEKKEKPKEKKFCMEDTMASMITLDTVKLEVVKNEISLNGKVSFDLENVVKIYPLAGGYVENIYVELGDKVKKGQTLALIASTEIVNLEEEYAHAEADLTIEEKNLSAAKDMYESGISSQKEYVTAQKEFSKAQSEMIRIQSVMKLYGQSDHGHYYIKSPIDGFIVERQINPNTQLRPDNPDNIFTVSDLADVWVLANVYESDISKVQEGYSVKVTTISYPDLFFPGKIDKVYNVLDPATRSMKVRVKLDNKDFKLKPEMYASVHVAYQENNKMLAIPSSATIFDNSRNYVLVYREQCIVNTVEVNVIKTVAGISYIAGGSLKEGDRIITKYQLLIYDALNN
jgi:cobalt-zinc-cadmium efflux system membrane fusion protein